MKRSGIREASLKERRPLIDVAGATRAEVAGAYCQASPDVKAFRLRHQVNQTA